MKSLTFTILVLFGTYFFKLEIAKYQISNLVNQHKADIQFVGSLMPVLCQVEKIQNDFQMNSNDINGLMNAIEKTTQQSLPELKRAIENISPNNQESFAIKNTIEEIFNCFNSENQKLSRVIADWKSADGFWSVLWAGYQTYEFSNSIDIANNKLKKLKRNLDTNTNNYANYISTEIANISTTEVWSLFIYKNILTSKDKVEINNYTRELIIKEVTKEVSSDSDCVKEQILKISNQLSI